MVNPGDWGNLPRSEACVASVEGTANGVVVVNGFMASVEVFTQLIKIVFRDGIATHIERVQKQQSLTSYYQDTVTKPEI